MKKYVFTATFFFFSLSACMAAEEAGVDKSAFTDFLYRLLNFSVMVAILYIVAKKMAITDFFSIKREEIKRRFEELKRQKYEFEKKADELESKLREIEEKKKEIIEQFRLEGLREKEKIIAEAKQRAAQIMAQADMAIQQEVEAAKERLKAEIIDLATDKAKEIISNSIKDKDQDKLVQEFIEKMERVH